MAKASARPTKRKVINIDAGVLRALEDMVRDGVAAFDQLADRAFRDFLKKHRRPVSLQDALRQSARSIAANDAVRGHAAESVAELAELLT